MSLDWENEEVALAVVFSVGRPDGLNRKKRERYKKEIIINNKSESVSQVIIPECSWTGVCLACLVKRRLEGIFRKWRIGNRGKKEEINFELKIDDFLDLNWVYEFYHFTFWETNC